MTNPERAIKFMAERLGHWGLGPYEIDAIVAYGIECANAELEKRRVAEALVARLQSIIEIQREALVRERAKGVS